METIEVTPKAVRQLSAMLAVVADALPDDPLIDVLYIRGFNAGVEACAGALNRVADYIESGGK